MTRLIRELLRPYRWSLSLVFAAMTLQTVMSLAGPWPLKVILDNVVGSHHLRGWPANVFLSIAGGEGKMQIAVLAAAASVLIAAISGAASYIGNYYTESIGQWVAHDLRIRTYHHLQRLSLRYYESQKVGTILSTLTTDIATIQNFASS
jgi:subfamily B ATP-binding cassette protein MsbA